MSKEELVENIKKLDKPGRDKTKKLIESMGYEFLEPKNEKLSYDCYFISKGKMYLIEIKDRDPKNEKYDDFILECDKYNRIQNWKRKLNAAGCYYFNWFGDKCYVFNLDNPEIIENKTVKKMNAVTAASRFNKIDKDIYLIKKKLGKIYTLY